MKPIGGFFELELNYGNEQYHKTQTVLSTGRSCLNLIIKEVSPSKIFLPYYICDSLIEPIANKKINYQFYSLNQKLEPEENILLKDNEYIIYINYFGLMKGTVGNLIEKYPNNLILDNTQAFYEKGFSDIWSFNSARKFFGVPDGAFLYSPYPLITDLFNRNGDFHYDHLVHRLIKKQEIAYKEFVAYEKSLNDEIKYVSILSELLLSNIDYQKAKEKRIINYKMCHSAFKEINQLNLSLQTDSVPMVYPLLVETNFDREVLFKKNIFIPTFWEDVLQRSDDENIYKFEKRISKQLLPLPVDQRYGIDDMNYLISEVHNLIENKVLV